MHREAGCVLLGSTVYDWLSWFGLIFFHALLEKTHFGWFGWSLTFSTSLKPGWDGWKSICVITSHGSHEGIPRSYHFWKKKNSWKGVEKHEPHRSTQTSFKLKPLIPIEQDLGNKWQLWNGWGKDPKKSLVCHLMIFYPFAQSYK